MKGLTRVFTVFFKPELYFLSFKPGSNSAPSKTISIQQVGGRVNFGLTSSPRVADTMLRNFFSGMLNLVFATTRSHFMHCPTRSQKGNHILDSMAIHFAFQSTLFGRGLKSTTRFFLGLREIKFSTIRSGVKNNLRIR